MATKNLRLLLLALNLVNTELGLSKADLSKRIPQYFEMTSITFDRTFERDISSLRRAGFVISASDTRPPLYLAKESSFPAEKVSFTAGESEIVVQAAQAWQGVDPVLSARIVAKLTPYFDEGVSAPASHFEAEGANHLTTILKAIETRQPIHFIYAGRSGPSERDVAPWALEARGAALYLRGFDLNRWAQRTFRLSRIIEEMSFVAEENAFEAPKQVDDPRSDEIFTVEPLLLVRDGCAAVVRLRLEKQNDLNRPVPLGWQLFKGLRDERTVWERLIYDHLEDLVVVEPLDLRSSVIENLEALGGNGGR